MARFPINLQLLAAFFLNSFAQRGLESIWVLYTDFRFDWSVLAGSWSLAYVGLISAMVQGGLVRLVVPRLGEARTVIIGLSIAAVSGFGFAFTSNGFWAVPVIGFYVLGYDLAGPALRSLISGPFDAGQQGRLQGVMGSLN